MCYLVAKHIDAVGCVALKTTHGEHLSKFKRNLEAQVGYEKIQLVTISNKFKTLRGDAQGCVQ